MSQNCFELHLDNGNTQSHRSFIHQRVRVLKCSSGLIAMKRKLEYSFAVGRKLTTSILNIDFFHSQNQKAKAGSIAFRSRNFHAMHLAAGSFVFA